MDECGTRANAQQSQFDLGLPTRVRGFDEVFGPRSFVALWLASRRATAALFAAACIRLLPAASRYAGRRHAMMSGAGRQTALGMLLVAGAVTDARASANCVTICSRALPTDELPSNIRCIRTCTYR